MRKHLTADDYISEVKMMRTQYSGVVLVVEGDSDAKLFSSMTSRGNCRTLPVNGRETALQVANKIDAASLVAVLVILDADFDHVEGVVRGRHVAVTDTHDIETMIISSDAWRRFIIERGSGQKLRKLSETKPYAKSKRLLYAAGLPFGVCRWISHRDKLGLHFRGLKYSKLVDRESLSVDYRTVATAVANRSSSVGVTAGKLAEMVAEVVASDPNPEQFCSGHDLAEITSIALRKCFATLRAEECTADLVRSMFRLSYGVSDLRKTNLYQQVSTWLQREGVDDIFQQ